MHGQAESCSQYARVGKYEKIAALKKLLDSGAITQQEFESEKSKILSSP